MSVLSIGKNTNEFMEAVATTRERLITISSPTLDDARRSFKDYHMASGKLHKALCTLLNNWRDFTRPALIALSCEAVGGDPRLTVGMSKALILCAAGLDVHDDIIDDSVRKGSKKTTLGEFERDITLLTGDTLIIKSLLDFSASACDQTPQYAKKIILTTLRLLLELCDAEAAELNFRARTDVSSKEYLEVIRLKAADVEAYTRIGAIVGGGSEQQIEALAGYGRKLGMLVILRDDLADLLDSTDELPHRIKYETLPFPLILALERLPRESYERRILQKRTIRVDDAKQLFQACVKCGALNEYGQILNRVAQEAIAHLSIVKEKKDGLVQIVKATVPPI